MQCYLFEPPHFFFIAEGVPELLYYSHIPTTFLALLVGVYVLLNSQNKLLGSLLFFITVFYAMWTIASLVAWTNINADLVAFIWPAFSIAPAMIAILSIYFALVFYYKSDISHRIKIIFLLLIAPVFIFAHTNLHFSGFDLINCDAFAYEGLLYKTYFSLLGILACIWILIAARQVYYKVTTVDEKNEILLLTTGLIFFLFFFISATYAATYMVQIGLLVDSSLEMYSLFGMVFFIAMIGILVVKYKTFNLGIFAAQALVVVIVILVAAQFTYPSTSPTALILKLVTLFVTIAVGWFLIRSVTKEIKQKEKIEDLAKQLAKANKRLRNIDKLKSEFVSIASHQLRSPLTAIRGYASMLLSGSYGTLPSKVEGPVKNIEESARLMTSSVEDYLNVSRIESGNMKYDYSDFNLKDLTSTVVDSMRPEAIKSSLVLSFKSELSSTGIINADKGKVQQIFHNLINNSIKYTQKGSITIYVHDDRSKQMIFVEIIDTGVGMSEVTQERIFQKFQRAEGASSINAHGTGLGLYIAKKMAVEMGGDITAYSEGEGKGSHFVLHMPLKM